MPEANINPVENGPLLVSGIDDLRGPEGPIDVSDTFALCRCGASMNKPFCDGAHGKIGFSGAKDEGRTEDRRDDYAGAEITVHDNRGQCAHAGVCTERLPAVWRMKQEPWIDPDGAPPAEVAAVVRACPSGALAYSGFDDGQDETELGPSVLVAPNGPYVVQGSPGVTGEEPRSTCTLCRCGASKNKPFCDGTHWSVEFRG